MSPAAPANLGDNAHVAATPPRPRRKVSVNMRHAYAAALIAVAFGLLVLAAKGNTWSEGAFMAALQVVGMAPEMKVVEVSTPLASAPSTSQNACADLNPHCPEWARQGECGKNKAFMEPNCPKSCATCDIRTHAVAKVSSPSSDPIRAREQQNTKCRDKNDMCLQWAAAAECEKNPQYMKIHCPISCDTCDWADYEKRCTKNPDSLPALAPGDIGKLFSSIEQGAFRDYQPSVVSRPPAPWLVVFDSFLTEAEVDAVLEVARRDDEAYYVPSQGTGGLDADGTLKPTQSSYRTSSTNWCNEGCVNETAIAALRQKVVELTGIPDENHEYPQMLRYRMSEYYKEHSDYIPAHRDMPCGPRVYTVFFYLSDVEEGGYTSFPGLGLSVKPKRGRAVLWPSVLDDRPFDCDTRTQHIAEPVLNGTKFSVNFWLHQHNFKANHQIGCTG